MEFYREFSENLKGAVSLKQLPTLILWKALGDELVFYSELRSQQDAVDLMEVFVQQVLYYRNSIKEKHPQGYLDLKGSAWIAGFPVKNSIVFPETGGVVDFIGPSIDIGFRIAKYTSPDALCISVELAALLIFSTIDSFTLRFESTVQLKGVLNNKSYPLICIKPNQCVPTKDNQLACKEFELRTETPPQKLKAYCKEFIDLHSDFLSYPFIDGDKNFSARPDNYAIDLDAITTIYNSLVSPIRDFQNETPPIPSSSADIQKLQSGIIDSLERTNSGTLNAIKT